MPMDTYSISYIHSYIHTMFDADQFASGTTNADFASTMDEEEEESIPLYQLWFHGIDSIPEKVKRGNKVI